MGAGKRAAAQAPVTRECLLLHQIADRAESPVFQLAHIELPVRSLILRPAQEDVARRLHDALALDHPLALVPLNFCPSRSSADLPASLICRNSGVPSPHINSPMAQNVPTPPTPTTLNATSLSAYRSTRQSRSGAKRL